MHTLGTREVGHAHTCDTQTLRLDYVVLLADSQDNDWQLHNEGDLCIMVGGGGGGGGGENGGGGGRKKGGEEGFCL